MDNELEQFQIEMTEESHAERNAVIPLSARMGEWAGVRWHYPRNFVFTMWPSLA